MADATQLAEFARAEGVGSLSMRSAARDRACPGGAKQQADATCSSVERADGAVTEAFAAFRP